VKYYDATGKNKGWYGGKMMNMIKVTRENGNGKKSILVRKKFPMHAFGLNGKLNLSLHEKKVLGGIPTRVECGKHVCMLLF